MNHRMMIVALLALAPLAGCKDKGSAPGPGATPATPAPAATATDTASGSAAAPAAPADPKPADPAPTTAAAAPAWETATSKAGGFSIELPGKATEQQQGGMTILGVEFGTTATDDRTAMCGAVFVELPSPPPDVKTMLDGAMARHKEGAKVIEEKDVTLGKVPGRHLVVENGTHRKYMRVFLKEKTMYLVNCGGPFDRAATDGPIETRVVESFQLI